MTGIILAGGENRRMGTDKAFLELSGKPMIERVMDVLRTVCRRLIIVTNSPERYAAYEETVIMRDVLGLRGPLTGIYSGLTRSEEEYNFITACDMPFLNAGLIAYLEEQATGYDVTLPEVEGRAEPLHAVYHRRLLPAVEAKLREERREIRGILDAAKVRYITADEVARFDPDHRSFKNINTRREYEEALCSDWGCRNS